MNWNVLIVRILTFAMALAIPSCVGGTYQQYSTNDIPFQNRSMPSPYRPIIIKGTGPQLPSGDYSVLGRVKAFSDNVTVFENRCKEAIELLRVEAKRVGADALISIECGGSAFGASASGIAIVFKNRESALKKLQDINALTD
jgi:hypothetical protein